MSYFPENSVVWFDRYVLYNHVGRTRDPDEHVPVRIKLDLLSLRFGSDSTESGNRIALAANWTTIKAVANQKISRTLETPVVIGGEDFHLEP